MACSLVFSQSRVDFLDAFDESESSVPGTISMLFSILSACLCAWVVSESMTMRSVSFFYSDVFRVKDKRVLLKNRLETFIRKTQKKRENLIMTSAISCEGHHRPSPAKNTHFPTVKSTYSWSISKSAYALRKTSDETSSSYSSFKQQNFPIPLLRL